MSSGELCRQAVLGAAIAMEENRLHMLALAYRHAYLRGDFALRLQIIFRNIAHTADCLLTRNSPHKKLAHSY